MISEQLSIDQPISGGSGWALKRALGLCCEEEEVLQEKKAVSPADRRTLADMKEVSGGSQDLSSVKEV